MNRLKNKTNVFKGLAVLIFAAILVNMAFSRPVAAFATLNSHVYLPIIAGGAGGPVVTPTPMLTQTATSSPTPTPTSTPPAPPPGTTGALFLDRTIRTDSASSAVDAAGGVHLAYVKYGAMVDGNQVYYAYCATTADCGIVSSWGTVILIDRVEEVQLALTAAGHPRLLLRGPSPDWSTDFYKYAACDVNCTNSANWTIADVTTTTFSGVYLNSYSGHHYFALDNQDRPRFLYQDTYTIAYYVYCDTACTSAASWWKDPINADIYGIDLPTLTFTSLGQPRITAVIADGTGNSYLNYITCDTLCNNLASWTYTRLMDRGGGINVSFVLRLTSNGQPRLAFNQGWIGSGPPNYLWYLWCNTGCTNSANWAGSSVGEKGQSEDADLALDALDRPRIAFRNILSPDGLGYVWCNTNCESTSATWQGGLLEPSSVLDVEWDIPIPLNCSGSYWWGGYRPSLALDTAGNPRIGYVAQHLHGGGSSCLTGEDYRAVRFVFFNQP
jgi:hypothetical protein